MARLIKHGDSHRDPPGITNKTHPGILLAGEEILAEPVKIEKAVLTTEMITVKDLSEKIGKPAAEIIKKLFILGIMATINQEIDYDTCSLIAADYGIELELMPTQLDKRLDQRCHLADALSRRESAPHLFAA